MKKWNIALTETFYKAFLSLDPPKSQEVWKAIGKLRDGLASVHLHKLEGSGLRSFGVNSDAYRIICEQEGDLLLLLHVGPHDAAYDWANRNKVRRVGSTIRIVETEVVAGQASATSDEEQPPGPLAHVADKWFRKLEVEPRAAGHLRTVPDEDTLVEVACCFPPALGEALLGFASDPNALAECVNAFVLAGEEAVDPVSLADAVADTRNAGTTWLVPPSEAALAAALDGSLASWRVFLHPSQQRVVQAKASGATKVTGGPGTGKTIVALHRARLLAEELFASDERPVLMTTFSATLAASLRALLQQLCHDAPQLLERIHVTSLVALSRDLAEQHGVPASFLSKAAIDAAWEQALAHDSLGLGRRFYESERVHVLERQGAWTEEAYSLANRVGRGKAIDRRSRRQVWRVLETFEHCLAAAGGGDAIALAREAANALRTGPNAGLGAQPYAAVICDEIQDVSASQLRLLSALTSDGEGGIRPNALFMVGDGYQRLYSSPVSFASCGVPIVGRSQTLKLNYRTTEGIRRAAVAIVQGLELDDLDEGTAPLDGYRSLRGGPVPVQKSFGTPAAEADWIAQEIGVAGSGLTLVLTRTAKYRDQLRDQLAARGCPALVIETGDRIPDDAPVVLCTLHRSKGLEAPRVIVAGRQQLPARFPGGDETERKVWLRKESCLLYVGMTRARDTCAVTGVGP